MVTVGCDGDDGHGENNTHDEEVVSGDGEPDGDCDGAGGGDGDGDFV